MIEIILEVLGQVVGWLAADGIPSKQGLSRVSLHELQANMWY